MLFLLFAINLCFSDVLQSYFLFQKERSTVLKLKAKRRESRTYAESSDEEKLTEEQLAVDKNYFPGTHALPPISPGEQACIDMLKDVSLDDKVDKVVGSMWLVGRTARSQLKTARHQRQNRNNWIEQKAQMDVSLSWKYLFCLFLQCYFFIF